MKYMLLFLVLGILCSCNNSETKPAADKHTKIAALSWLQGEWGSPDGTSHELWSRKNDTTFTGFGYTLTPAFKDTIFKEHLSLEQRDSDLFFIPLVADQNDSKPVPFKLVSSANGTFIFENKEHDFPQRIVYTNPAPDSIYAWIEGSENGKYHNVGFPMKRVAK